ncbi:MAG: hypothetical protein IKT58_07175 [Oscillospiraceae bacterium]|nr:hypothetical protein [Oscillospiraceae bacterium]
MNAKELKNLSRGDLLEMLIMQTDRVERMEVELAEAKQRAETRDIIIAKSGTLAEAAMRINEVWQAADKAAAQYLSNILRMYDEQEQQFASQGLKAVPPPVKESEEILAEAKAKAEAIVAEAQTTAQTLVEEATRKSESMLAETTAKCTQLENETHKECEAMLTKAKDDSQAYWTNTYEKLEQYCASHESLKALLTAKG